MEITGGQSCLQLPFDAATPPPTIPTPRCPPCSLEKETPKPRSRMFLSVSIPYLQPPTLPPYQPPLFPLVSKKKVSSLKSQSLHPCFEFHASLSSQESYTSDYPFSCVVQSIPPSQDLFHHCLNILQSHLKKSLLHPVTSSFVSLLLFTAKLSKRSVSTSYFLLMSQEAPIWILPLPLYHMALAKITDDFK